MRPTKPKTGLWLNTVDRDRAAFVKHYYGGEWPDRHLFHLMLNTAVGFDLVVDAICQFKTALDVREPKESNMKDHTPAELATKS